MNKSIAELPPNRQLYDTVVLGNDREIRAFLKQYRETLPEERRMLFDRFIFVDGALKVVGVGSVGTR